MSASNKQPNVHTLKSRKSISWILIATVLALVLIPAHYHLHHIDSDASSVTSKSHNHVIDLHVLSEVSGSHHHDEELMSIAVSPDGIYKKSEPYSMVVILLAISFLLLSSLNGQINLPLLTKSIKLKQRYLHFKPLLRAPPLVQL